MEAGARNAKLEPRYAGAFPFVIQIKSSVPTPFISRTMLGLMPNRIGTRTDAPNIAKTCWMDSGIILARGSLSSTSMICFLDMRFPFR